MIAILGDIHGDSQTFHEAIQRAVTQGANVLIQVGDFGVYEYTLGGLIATARQSPIPVYFIDGNHEDYRILRAWPTSGVYDVVKGKLCYVRRGEVLEIDGRRVGFLGGAGSIDYAFRQRGRDWWPEDEQIKDSEVESVVAKGPVDFLITHTPPQGIVTKHFDLPLERGLQVRRMFGASLDWFDPSAAKVQRMWEALGKPPLFCGHMHTALVEAGVRILNVGEVGYV